MKLYQNVLFNKMNWKSMLPFEEKIKCERLGVGAGEHTLSLLLMKLLDEHTHMLMILLMNMSK